MELYRNIGRSYQGLLKFKKASKCYFQALKIHDSISDQHKYEKTKADILVSYSQCLKEEAQYDDANNVTWQALTIYWKLWEQGVKNIVLHKEIGACLWKLRK